MSRVYYIEESGNVKRMECIMKSSYTVHCVLVHSKGRSDAKLLGVYLIRDAAEKARDRAQMKFKGHSVSVLKKSVSGKGLFRVIEAVS